MCVCVNIHTHTYTYTYTYQINKQSLMAWQHQDVGVTPTIANSVPKKDPIRIDYKSR